MKYFVLCWLLLNALLANAQMGQFQDSAKLDRGQAKSSINHPGFTVKYNPDSLTGNDGVGSSLRFSRRQLYIPAGLILAGIATTGNGEESAKNELVEERNEHFSDFRTHVDNYLQYSPLLITYGLDAFGLPSKTNFNDRTAILIKGELLMFSTVTLLKNTTHELRPDGSSDRSFPSGHTAQAFAGATFLSEEYKYRYKWMPYAAYSLASGIGLLRMANNKHYICDVLVGAGMGILSTKIAYWTHQYKWGRKKHAVVVPND